MAQGEVLAALLARGLRSPWASSLWRRWGAGAPAVFDEDPYAALLDLPGLGFAAIDEVALARGVQPGDRRRIAGALAAALRQAADDGHVCLPPEALLRRGARLLQHRAPAGADVDEPEALLHALQLLEEAGRIVLDGDACYLPDLYEAEVQLADDLLRVARRGRPPVPADEVDAVIARTEARLGVSLAAEQRRAVALALTQPLVAVTGGPGTGKTTLLRVLCHALLARSPRPAVALAAPTGRAARRLSELTGVEAQTIHRLLEFQPGEDGEPGGFRRHRDAPLEVDLVVVDEASMLDVPLAAALLAALPDGAALVLVGDVDQLPPVGPGDVLRDLIASGAAPVVRLTRVYRQAEGSAVAQQAARVREGLLPELPAVGCPDVSPDGCALVRADDQTAAARVVECVRALLARGVDPEGVQVLAPMRGGPAGVGALNGNLQEALNPGPAPELRSGGRLFRTGDRVMCIRNNYAKGEDGIFNGQLGRVEAVAEEEEGRRRLVVRFDAERVTYEEAELDQLALGYAATVHKAQGSEFDVCVLCLVADHRPMLRRNLLYTAITRARRGLVVVGSPDAVRRAVADRRVDARHGRLAARLRAN